MLLAWLATALADPGPTVDLAEEAELLFRLGLAAYREGEVEVALERLLASNRLVPNRNVAFNVARCHERLGALDQAWRYYDAYVRAEPDPAARQEAEAALARLDAKVARVEVRTDPPGATVYVGRRDLGSRGTTPLVLALPAGEHTLVLDREGSASVTTSAKWVVGRREVVDVRLPPIEAPAPPPAPPPAPEPPPARWSATVVTVGNTVLLRVVPGSCGMFPDIVAGAGAPLDGPEPTSAPGSAVALSGPPSGIAVDTTIDGRVVRARLVRADRRSLALSDASALHAAFARCRPTDPGGLADALRTLPTPVRADAAAVIAEWAAWNGAGDTAAAAASCAAGDCEPLVAALLR